METDKTTYLDLSLFNREEEFSVFHKLNFTRTSGGKEYLKVFFNQPLKDTTAIHATQETVKYLLQHAGRWPVSITNGTVMVMEKFFDTHSEPIPLSHGGMAFVNDLFYRVFNSADYSLIKYSLSHFNTFLKGFKDIIREFDRGDTPSILKDILQKAANTLSRKELQEMMGTDMESKIPYSRVLYFGHQVKYFHHHGIEELIQLYSRLDAYYSMAMAVQHFQLSFPSFTAAGSPVVRAKGLYHILLGEPVAYDIALDRDHNFLFLTGANMAGKSTFIKAIGIAVFLAHTGMGVPAQQMELSYFNGLLSNIQVEDNVLLGESYFYNEVQRIKKMILKINDGRHWLILIDELFKGTNFQDARNCSAIVIEGLLKMRNSLFILSTHLYEIAEGLRKYPNISFKYFEAGVTDNALQFSYQLKDGISQDRFGYLILEREKVIELLEQIRDSG